MALPGVEALARMAWIFWGAIVEGCAHRFSCASVRTRHHPGTIAAPEGRIWLPRACDRPTEALGYSLCKGKSAIFLSKALRLDRCAAWHRARALRNTVWIRVSHPAASEWCSTETSGVSSKKAWLRSCNSERTARADFASMRSWYCRDEMVLP